MAREFMTESPASLADASGDQAISQTETPGTPSARLTYREQYLSRFGSTATLMTVETFEAPDGSLRTRRSFAVWPGL